MEINGLTQLVGIIANPIGHVRTPQLFNASVAAQGINAACVPFHVREEQLAAGLAGLPALSNLLGLVVTIPYKEAVLPHCRQLTDTARLVGSVNAMRYDRERACWVGGNFDGDGFVAGLRQQGHGLAGKRVLLVGAGGAGKSIAHAIAREAPTELVIANRSPARAAELARRLQLAAAGVAIDSGDADPAGFDVVVNATSLGLRDGDELPVALDRLGSGSLVCEAVVRDGDTRLLAAARSRGCPVHHGQHMLYGQIVEIARFLGVALKPEHVARILGPR